MEIVLKFESKNLQKVKDVLLKDDSVSRASMTFKDASFVNEKGYYCYISGTDEQCKKAMELSKELTKEISGEEKQKVILKIKEEENKAIEGMGGIFG